MAGGWTAQSRILSHALEVLAHHWYLTVTIVAVFLSWSLVMSPGAVEAGPLMCGTTVQARPQTVSIDPDLSRAGLTHADVAEAFRPWNALFTKYHGFPIFVAHTGNWWDADILLTAHGDNRTWVNNYCIPGYAQRGLNHSIVHVGHLDAWRNRQILTHELGHTLGLADYGAPANHTSGHIGFQPCDGTYYGVMSYCTGQQSWFLDYRLTGAMLDGDLVRNYWGSWW